MTKRKKNRKKKRKEKNKKNNSQNSEKTLQTIKYLKENGINSLKKKFHIKIKKHKKYENIVQLNYNNLRSDFSKRIVQECRNLIVDTTDDEFKIICLGFFKFFNYVNKKCVAKIPEFSKVKIFNKFDGSIIILYNYNNKWEISSNNCPDASGKFNKDSDESLADLFWDIFKELKYELPTSKSHVYVFELISIKLLQIVQYKKNDLILLGVRNMKNLEEIYPNEYIKKNKLNWKYIQEIKQTENLNSIEKVIKHVENQDPLKFEGVVLTFKNEKNPLFFDRIKVKNSFHVLMSNLKNIPDSNNNNNNNIFDYKKEKLMLNLLYTNEKVEFLLYFPKFTKLYEKVNKEFLEWCEFLSVIIIEKSDLYYESIIQNNEILLKIYNDVKKSEEEEDEKKFNLKLYLKENIEFNKFYKIYKKFNYTSLILTQNLNSIYKKIESKYINSEENKKLIMLQEKMIKKLRLIIIKSKFKKSKLKKFGSNSYGTSFFYQDPNEERIKTDIDLCLYNFNISQIKVLEKIIKNDKEFINVKLREYKNINIIKFEYHHPDNKDIIVLCDLSINSEKNIKKSEIIKEFVKFSDSKNNSRGLLFLKFVILVKYLFKKRFKISKYNKLVYLNSFALINMIIFHLQKENYFPKSINLPLNSKKNIKNLKNFEDFNLGKLFLDFFLFYEQEFNYEKDVISIRLGKLLSIDRCKLKKNQNSAFYIEDPLEWNENLARTITIQNINNLKNIFSNVLKEIQNENDIFNFFEI